MNTAVGDYLTTGEVAEIIRTSTDYVSRQCANGAIRAKRVGREWRIHRDEVTRFMGGGRAPATRPQRRRAS